MISLKVGLNWLIGLVLAATLFINLGIQLMHAGPRVRAEAGSNLRLAREFVLNSIANIPDRGNPIPSLQNIFANLGSLRHVEIRILGATERMPEVWSDLDRAHDHNVPAWFVRLVGATPRVVTIPLELDRRNFGRVAIISNPLDELQEIWSDMTWLASISLAVTLFILVLVLILLRYALSPFDALQRGLSDLEAGKWNVKLAPWGATEFRNIATALNALASTLDRVRAENRELVSELIELQDNERRELARDLHDEAGPCLFSIRAAATSLQDAIAHENCDQVRVTDLSSVIERSSKSLQLLFRSLLGRLRPQGLDELGLEASLKALFDSWRISHPEVALNVSLPHDLSSLDAQTSTAAYRVVQEAVTNVFRHSHARRAEVMLAFALGRGGEGGDHDAEGAPQLEISIEDDGVGIPERPSPGIGLLGMRERVQALGGAFVVSRRPAGGTRVLASIPVTDESDFDGSD
jgi:two-component system, NarL family, sensor histidine kinase UhpB